MAAAFMVGESLVGEGNEVAHIDLRFFLPVLCILNFVNKIFDRLFKIQKLSVCISWHNP